MRLNLRRFAGEGEPGRLGGESGDIVTGWLLRLVVFMAILAFIGYEVIVVGLNYVSAEDAAQEVARAARSSYRETQDQDLAEEAALREAEFRDVELVTFEVEEEHISATVSRTADTLVAGDLGFLDGVTARTATSRIRWRD